MWLARFRDGLEDRLRPLVGGRPLDRGDPDGLDPDFIGWLAPRMDRAITRWFDHDIRGLENIPEGPALLVGNHNSGAMFLEAIGFGARWYIDKAGSDGPDGALDWSSIADNERLHGLGHDNIVETPLLGRVLLRLGVLRAGHEPAGRAFEKGRKVVVFPGGNREGFRPFRDRYRVAMGDRRGYVRLALAHGVPIVPMVFVGGHSGFLIVSDNKWLARLLGAKRWMRSDTWPMMLALPWGFAAAPIVHLPLPVGCITEVLEPIDVTPWLDRPHDPAVWDEVAAVVEDRMQIAMDRLAAERKQRPWPLRRRRSEG
jgi:1-acyl-sn-glycerol-3-phosphate acyltransferase